ncbi:MAG: hypothetical protein SNG27_03980 [Rikenellaceae bacterium]
MKDREVSKLEGLLFAVLIVCNNVVVNFIGEISVGFIFIVATSLIWFPRLNMKNPMLFSLFWLYVALICAQGVSEMFSSTTMTLKLKGIAVTINSLIVFLYFLYRYYLHLDFVKYYFLASAIARILIPDILSKIEGSEFGYYKFTLVPILINLLFFVALMAQQKVNRKIIALVIGVVGGYFIVTGARSEGLILFAAGVSSFLVLCVGRFISKKIIYRIGVMLAVVAYIAYAQIYVPMVLRGELDDVGNSKQLKKADNPYNPLYLIMEGRTDSLVPFIAFADKPSVGFGYFAKDPNFKYNNLLFQLKSGTKGAKKDYEYDMEIIPAHSVVGCYAVSYGIGGLVFMLLIVGRILDLGVLTLLRRDQYIYVVAFFLFNICWHLLFSPAAHFKTGIPIMGAFIVALYMRQIYEPKLYSSLCKCDLVQ